jgi:hypothetical protein
VLPGGPAGEVLKEMLKPKVLSLVQDLFSMTESEELTPTASLRSASEQAVGVKMTFLGI